MLLVERLELETIFNSLNVLRNKIDILKKTVAYAKITGLPIEDLISEHRNLYFITTNLEGDMLYTSEKRTEISMIIKKITLHLRKVICTVNKK